MTNQKFVDVFLNKLSFAKIIKRQLKDGVKIIFYDRKKYVRKCHQVNLFLNNNGQVSVTFIFWPRYYIKAKIININSIKDTDSPELFEWVSKKAEEAKKHLRNQHDLTLLN